MNPNYKVIIIDDEPPARTLLRGMIGKYFPEFEVVADCENLASGVLAIKAYKPDLVLLDIEMPGRSGLEIMDYFKSEEVDFGIIFTTAYNQYAIKAFKLSAVDYLLKPLGVEDLEESLNRFKIRRSQGANDLAALKGIMNPGSPISKLAIPSSNSLLFIDLETIRFFKADSSYTEIHYGDGQKQIVSRTLKNFEEALEGHPLFFRCHKSYMVNLKNVDAFVKSEGGYLMVDEERIPISSDRVSSLLELHKLVKR